MKKKLKFVLVPLAIIVLVMAIMGMAGTNGLPALADLNKVWDKHMINGDSVLSSYVNRRIIIECAGKKRTDGSVFRAGIPPSCLVMISIQDLREKGFFGIGTGGGWGLRGGLLNFIEIEQTRFELYGKEINRYRPGVFDNHSKSRDRMFEFFLLRRDSQSDEAIMIREWKFQSKQVPDLKLTEIHKVVRGFLTRENTDTLRVKILGVSNPVDETIQIGDTISKNR